MRSDRTGRFLLEHPESGHQVLVVEGRTANRAGYRYGEHEIGVDLPRGKTTQLGHTIWMTSLDPEGDRPFSGQVHETVLTTSKIPGLEIRIPEGSEIHGADGKPVNSLNLTPVPIDRPAFPLPPWIHVPAYFMVQPGRAYLSKGARIIYPNYHQRPAGTRVRFWNYDPEDRGWYVYGRGTVTDDEKQIVPDPGVRIWEFTGAMAEDAPPAPPDAPTAGGGSADGDPVDLRSGLFVYEKTDLRLGGEQPLAITRTYRPGDANNYAFGTGTTHPFDMRLWTQVGTSAQEGDLVLPDGGRVHFVRTNPGSSYGDSLYGRVGRRGAWKERV